MSMKLVFAVERKTFNSEDHLGVVKKVKSQMKLFNENGIETTLCQYEWKDGYPQIEIDMDTAILYFRRIEPSIKLLVKLRELKNTSSNLRIIMEIPTYPFAGEEIEKISVKRKVSRWIGERLIRFLIDRIVLVGQEKVIDRLYGIPVICASNGTDFNSIVPKKTRNDIENEIHMVCVSGCFFWHGYDRLIKGMNTYYQNKDIQENVYLHVVGQGTCLEEYVALANEYELNDKYIFFYGNREGAELDKIYDTCNIGIEVLGAHRKGMRMASSLKTREYAAKGLPIVSSVKLDVDNEETSQYILNLPSNDNEIEINKIVQFYHDIYDGKNKAEISKKIRECFYPYCDWSFVFCDVVEYIKRNC